MSFGSSPVMRVKRPSRLSLPKIVFIAVCVVLTAFCYINVTGAFSAVQLKQQPLRSHQETGTYSIQSTAPDTVHPILRSVSDSSAETTGAGYGVVDEDETVQTESVATLTESHGTETQETVLTDGSTEGVGEVEMDPREVYVVEGGVGSEIVEREQEINSRFVDFVAPDETTDIVTEAVTEAPTGGQTVVVEDSTEMVSGTPEWTGAVLDRFYIYDVRQASEKETSWEERCDQDLPEAFCSFLSASQYHTLEMNKAQLFLVPIVESMLFSEIGLIDSLKAMTHERYFLRFRGSDFIFLCYISDCQATEDAVMKALGKGIRAMWVDRRGDSTWPCSDRTIAVEAGNGDGIVSDWGVEGRIVEQVLISAGKLIEGRARWSCGTLQKWGLNNPSLFDFWTIKYISNKSIKDKVTYCGVPKVGSSITVLLMRRMNGMQHWKAENTLQIRNFNSRIDWTYNGKDDMIKIFDKTDWVKGMMVRDPITRLLSGYKSKIEQLREYNRVPGGWPKGTKPPTFQQFIARLRRAKTNKNLDGVDLHFRPQSALCGARTVPYDFIGRYEDRQEDFYNFLSSLELWEKLGASGWGKSGLSSLYSEDEGIIRNDKPKPVTHADSLEARQKYYTRELALEVIDIFSEDFERFGFSKNVDDYLGQPQ